jgi:hypothetical protein
VISKRLFRRVGAAFVDDQQPVGIRVFQDRLGLPALDDFQSEQVGQNRHRLVEKVAFVVAFDDPQ